MGGARARLEVNYDVIIIVSFSDCTGGYALMEELKSLVACNGTGQPVSPDIRAKDMSKEVQLASGRTALFISCVL